MPTAALDRRLAGLVAVRCDVADQLHAAARQAGAGTFLLIGSLSRRTADAFSDLNLILVPGPGYTGIDWTQLFGDNVLARFTDRVRYSPRGERVTRVCLKATETLLWLDLIEWPAATAAVPADSIIVYDHLNLPYSQLGYHTLLRHYATATTPNSGTAAALHHIAVASRYLARSDLRSIVRRFPEAASMRLDQVRQALHRRLSELDVPGLAAATDRTAALVDLADAARSRETPRGLALRQRPTRVSEV